MWLDWTFANQINVLLTPPHTRTCTHCCCLLSFLSCKPDVATTAWAAVALATPDVHYYFSRRWGYRREEGQDRRGVGALFVSLENTHPRSVVGPLQALTEGGVWSSLSSPLSLSLCNWIQLRWKCSEGALQFALLNNNVCSGVAWAAVHFERSRSSVQTHRGQCTGRLQPDHTGLWWKPVLLRTVKSPAGVFIYGFKQKKTTTKTLWAHEPWHDDSGHTQPQGLLLVKVSNVDCCSSSLSVWMIVI